MKGTRCVATLAALAVCLGHAINAAAQVPDHLKCYRMRDALKLAATVNLDSLQFGLESGCTVSSAKLFCVPAMKTVVSATNKGTGTPITPLPFSAAPTPEDRICYKLKCPAPSAPIADQTATDQFGTRMLTRFTASMLCTPAVKGAAFCGNGSIDAGEDCEGANLGGATCESEGFPYGGTLACLPGCTFDTSGCRRAGLPASGQTTTYTADKNDGIPGPVAVPDDGTVRAGAVLRYMDNGDGTITDLNTGLMWEKKGDDGSLHDKDNLYQWTGDGSQETIWDWLDDVNAEGGTGFAGYNDWRVPNAKELQSIVDYERRDPAVDPVFNSGCAPSCTVLTCSCTSQNVLYWSSTKLVGSGTGPNSSYWSVGATLGNVTTVSIGPPINYGEVRAVRGGS